MIAVTLRRNVQHGIPRILSAVRTGVISASALVALVPHPPGIRAINRQLKV